MTIRRRVVPGSLASTRGHSVIRQRSYGGPFVSRSSSDFCSEESYVSPPARVPHKRVEHGYAVDLINASADRAHYIGSGTVEDVNNIADLSRKRDAQLLASANAAAVKSQQSVSTKSLVANRRVTGAAPASSGYSKVVNRSSSYDKARKPAGSLHLATEAEMAVDQFYDATEAIKRPIQQAKEILLKNQARKRAPNVVSSSIKLGHHGGGAKPSSPPQSSAAAQYRVVPKSYRSTPIIPKAALIAGKVDYERKTRRPQSAYAADRYRQLELSKFKAPEPESSGRAGPPSSDGVSSVRQKLRKTIAKSKNDPSYY